MKTFIRGILTTVLVFTFTLIPTIIYAEKTINQGVIGSYGKEELTKQMTETFAKQFPELSDEQLNTLEENLRNNEKIDKIVDKYSNRIIKDLSEENIEDFDIEEDLKTIIMENKETVEDVAGQEVTEEQIDKAMDEIVKNEDLNQAYQQIITQTKQDMPEESQALIDSYNNVTKDNFMIGLIIVTIISIIIIALLKKPYYKWIVNIGIAGIIAALFIALIGGCIALLLNVVMESMNNTTTVSAMPMLLTSIIMLIVSIILLIINSVLDKKKGEKHAIS